MRSNGGLLLTICVACVGSAQDPAPIPADPYELVTGAGKTPKPMDRTQALALLNQAKRTNRRSDGGSAPRH
jgi:hypothetical protein